VKPQDQIIINMNFGLFEKGLAEAKEIKIPCSRQLIQGTATDTVAAVS